MAAELPPAPGGVPGPGQDQVTRRAAAGEGSPAAADLVYFLHIPKTSGISLQHFLLQIGGPENVSPSLLWDHLVTGTYQVSEQTRFLTGHFGGLLPLWLKRWPRILTMLREPLARAVSHINHIQREEQHPLHALAAGLSVLQYCEHPVLRRTIDNLQARYLASLSFSLALLPKPGQQAGGQAWGSVSVQFEEALSALDRETGLLDAALRALAAVDAFGLCEAHGASLRIFARLLGWEGEITEVSLNTAPPGQRSRTSLSATEIQTLADLNVVDTQLYQHALKLFLDTCQAYGIPLEEETVARFTTG
jgi:hypothetical protein